MRQERFTEQAQEVLAASQQLVNQFHHNQWDVEYILLALLQQEKGLVGKILSELALIDAKETTLISKYDEFTERQETIKKEINRIESLRAEAEEARVKANEIKKELKTLKEQKDAREKILTDNNWSIPIPQMKTGNSTVRM